MKYRELTKKIFNNLQYNASRVHLEQFLREAARSVSTGSRVLDAGAGDTRYRKLFVHVNYESADFCQSEMMDYGEIDYICDLATIPVEAERYDLVICTQVLEHVAEPNKVLSELYRVLKPGCSLWLTAPLFFAEHMQPFDYYRYTQFGLEYLITSAGFKIKQLNRLEGYYATLAYQLATAAKELPVLPGGYGSGLSSWLMALVSLPLKTFFMILAIAFSNLERNVKNVSVGYSKNYAVVALKP